MNQVALHDRFVLFGVVAETFDKATFTGAFSRMEACR